MPNDQVTLLLPFVFLLMAFRIWSGGARLRRVRIETMWIFPVIFIGLIGFGIYADRPNWSDPVVVAILVVSAVAGLGLGWFRGRLVKITVDPETHTLQSQNSAMGMVILAVIYLIKYAARTFLSGHADDWHISVPAVTDGFLLIALGTIVGRRIEILIRGLRLLKKAREDKAAGKTVPAEVSEDHA